jgi:hypothetical protein
MLPWAGLLGRIADECLYCGEKGDYFSLSSNPIACLCRTCPGQNRDKQAPKPDKKLFEKYKNKCIKLSKEWCKKNNVSYEHYEQELLDDLNRFAQEGE